MKKCTKCGLEKTLDCFHKDKGRNQGGFQRMCRACAKAYNKAWRENNKARRKAYKKAYYQANKEELVAYYHANKEKCATNHKAWQQNNPDKMRATSRKRRAMRVNLNENYTKEDEAFTLGLFDSSCFNCGSTENLTVDHYRPLIKGNALTLTNAIILCRSCNSSKGSKDPEQFFSEEQTMIIQEVFNSVEEIV